MKSPAFTIYFIYGGKVDQISFRWDKAISLEDATGYVAYALSIPIGSVYVYCVEIS